MPKTITVSDSLFSRLEALAQPFVDRNPEDVINRLVENQSSAGIRTRRQRSNANSSNNTSNNTAVKFRTPRERGVTVDLDGSIIAADTVPDLCQKVMEYLDSQGHWKALVDLAPYKTSSKRYFFSKSPVHPNGNDFFVPIKYRNLYVETHKNYKTVIRQLTRLMARLDIALTYRGT